MSLIRCIAGLMILGALACTFSADTAEILNNPIKRKILWCTGHHINRLYRAGIAETVIASMAHIAHTVLSHTQSTQHHTHGSSGGTPIPLEIGTAVIQGITTVAQAIARENTPQRCKTCGKCH